MSSQVAPPAGRRAQVVVSERARLIFVVTMIAWLAFPFFMVGRIAVDAVPLIAAGRVAAIDPADLYVPSSADPYAMSPRLRAESCAAMPEGADCDTYIVPFTHTPLVLPLIVPLAKLPTAAAVLVLRLIAAGGLVGGMALLWRSVGARSKNAAPMLAAAAVLLSPYAVSTIGYAQSSPILFLSVCLGVSATHRNRGAAAAGAAWGFAIIMKAYPAAVGVVAVAQRRWRLLAFTAAWCGALLIGAVLIGHGRVFADFLESTKGVRVVAFSNPYNRGIDGLIYTMRPSWNGNSPVFYVSVLMRIGVVYGLWRARVRHARDDVQWAFGWVAILWFIPVVWFHYFWVVVGAVYLMTGDRLAEDLRWARVFPITAIVISLGSVLDVQSSLMVAMSGLCLTVTLIGLAFFAVAAPAPVATEPALPEAA